MTRSNVFGAGYQTLDPCYSLVVSCFSHCYPKHLCSSSTVFSCAQPNCPTVRDVPLPPVRSSRTGSYTRERNGLHREPIIGANVSQDMSNWCANFYFTKFKCWGHRTSDVRYGCGSCAVMHWPSGSSTSSNRIACIFLSHSFAY